MMKMKGIVNYDNQVKFDSIPSDDDFELIKKFGQGDIEKDKIFVYKVLLCDNDCDRDIEQFTHNALVKLSEMFVGKVGIEDHQPTVHNNHSRIYKTELVVDDTRTNYLGDPYEYLVGYAYTLNDDFNKQLIEEIKSGIKKEVSVGVSNDRLKCSICGDIMYGPNCKHEKGHVYDSNTCVGLIDDIDDVYEWSFVSIPAQRNAGVIKSRKNKEDKVMRLRDMVLKAVNSKSVDSSETKELIDNVEKLEDVDTSMKALEDENSKLKSDLEAALKEIDEGKVRKLEEHIDSIIDSMKPKNDKVRAMLRRTIDEMIETNDNGELTDASEAAIRAELESDEYRPLYVDKSDDIEKADDVDKGCGDGDIVENGKTKSFEFTRSNNPVSKSFKQETGCMGIRFVDKAMN